MTGMAKFTLTIHTRTSDFSHTSAGEREGVAALLRQAAAQITASAAASWSLISSHGQIVGEYSFGEDMINGSPSCLAVVIVSHASFISCLTISAAVVFLRNAKRRNTPCSFS